MNTVEWSEALLLDYPPMDQVHHAFVDLLALAQAAPDEALPQAWSAVIDHTIQHFGREDDWMKRTRFAAADAHIMQHKVVLNVMREGLALARAGQIQAVREMAGELAAWFTKHTQTLDAALALHMRAAGAPTTPTRKAPRAGERASTMP
jgi:hemerythrin-like metal-binding protein